MIIDLPPQTEKQLIQTAHQQGISVAELIDSFLNPAHSNDIWLELDKHGLNSADFTINETEARHLMELLDNPPPPSPAMRELLALGENMVKSHV